MNRWMDGCLDEWMNEQMDEWMGSIIWKTRHRRGFKEAETLCSFWISGKLPHLEIHFCASLEDSDEDQNIFALHHYNLKQIELSPPPKDDTRKTWHLLVMNYVSLGLSSFFFSIFIFHQHKRMFFSFLILPEVILVWMRRSDKFLSKGNRAPLFLCIEDCLGKPAATTHHTLSTRNWNLETLWAWN